MRKILIPGVIALCALGAVPALAQDRSPIIYNFQGNMVGVIQEPAANGDAVVLTTKATVDLGYKVIFPAATLRPRPAGGWQTSLNNEQIAFLPPVPHQFFQRSGD
jgi:hypothetical protein